MIDFRFPARFTSSLSLQKSFISVFGFGEVLLRSRKKGHRFDPLHLHRRPMTLMTRGRECQLPFSISRRQPTFRIPVFMVDPASLECMSLFATLSAIRWLPHRFLCGYTYWNAISWIEVKYLNRRVARKDTLSRHSIHSFLTIILSYTIIIYHWKIYF